MPDHLGADLDQLLPQHHQLPQRVISGPKLSPPSTSLMRLTVDEMRLIADIGRGSHNIGFATYAVSGLAEIAAAHNNLFMVISALPPTADVPGGIAEGPFLTQTGQTNLHQFGKGTFHNFLGAPKKLASTSDGAGIDDPIREV